MRLLSVQSIEDIAVGASFLENIKGRTKNIHT